MEYFILIAFFIVTCMFAVFIDERMKGRYAKHQSESAFYKKTPINIAIDKHNECLSAWNKLSEEINNSLVKKRREVLFKQDKGANNALIEIVHEFNQIGDNISDYIRRSSECIHKNDIAGSTYCIGCINTLFNNVKGLIKAMEEIEVVDAFDNDFKESITIKKVDNEPSLFEGCTTKDEIEARYRHLAKAFHPDNTGGDKTMFERLQQEYKKRKE